MLILVVSSTFTVSAVDNDLIKQSLNIEEKLLPFNYQKNVEIKPEYIVIHETGNYDSGFDAEHIYSYWSKDSSAERSAHFIVDENKTIQMLKLNWKGWHVGDNNGHSDITNSNSIGIEICVNDDGNYMVGRARAIRLVKYLMTELNIDVDHVVRHFDASGKNCPEVMLKFPFLWDDFKTQIGQPDQIIDGIYKSMTVLETNISTNKYLLNNNLVESKLVLKKYNISPLLWNMLKSYPSTQVSGLHNNSRDISNLSPTLDVSTLQGLSASNLIMLLDSAVKPPALAVGI